MNLNTLRRIIDECRVRTGGRAAPALIIEGLTQEEFNEILLLAQSQLNLKPDDIHAPSS